MVRFSRFEVACVHVKKRNKPIHTHVTIISHPLTNPYTVRGCYESVTSMVHIQNQSFSSVFFFLTLPGQKREIPSSPSVVKQASMNTGSNREVPFHFSRKLERSPPSVFFSPPTCTSFVPISSLPRCYPDPYPLSIDI